MTTYLKPKATITVQGQTHTVAGGELVLDALAIPYGGANIDIPRTEDLGLDDMDPRQDVRVIVTAGDEVAGSTRTFNLGLRSRDIGDNGRSVSLVLATDEALLQDYAALVVDNGATGLYASLRSINNYVLSKIGASLAPEGGDADVRPLVDGVNLQPNGGFRADTAGWLGWNATALVRIAGGPPGVPVSYFGRTTFGTTALTGGIFNIGGENTAPPPSTAVVVTPGKSYTSEVWLRSSVTKTITPAIEWAVGGSGASSGTPVTLQPNVWTKVRVVGTAPAGATRAGCYWYTTTTWANGNTYDIAAHRFSETPVATLLPAPDPDRPSPTPWDVSEPMVLDPQFDWFDGDSTDTALYAYDWNGTPNQSSSKRTALVTRPPEALVWLPGVTAWDFLEPLNTPAGFRLFCDEKRVWRLVKPGEYSLPGVITTAGFNTVDGGDTISREDADIFCTGVVVIYRWKDATTLAEKVAYDSAGTPSKVFVVEYERPYPGPGAAAAILARRSGTGRTQNVVALPNWATTPGMEASITLPVAGQTRGKIALVRFSLGDDGLMELGTRGLIDVPPGSWDAGNEVTTWDNVAGTWDTFVWP
ncbi:hypothetical protein [Microbacterium sp. P5_E9]